MIRRHAPLMLAALGFALFAAAASWRAQGPSVPRPESDLGRVVISAPILVALYGGDRFLAAGFEVMRLAATGMDDRGVDTGYLIRAQQEVARLNACHEDNYFLANGLLTWGGAVDQGNRVLEAAVECRFWDYVPPFFYGINLSFFEQDRESAARLLEVSAVRSPENAANLRKMAILLRAEQLADERLALSYLLQQRDAAADPRLREMLGKRVVRLQGLVALREAQRRFEARRGALASLEQLVESGLLPALPDDPLRLGYELLEGRIILKKMKIAGMEDQP
jgi:hypothetical protein